MKNNIFKERTAIFSKIQKKLSELPWILAYITDAIFPRNFAQKYRTIRPYTICSYPRLRMLYQTVEIIVEKNIEGDVVECGTFRGGSAALMGLTLNHLNSKRKLWLFDTFEGMPEPSPADPAFARHWTGMFRADLSEVKKLLKQCNTLERCRIFKGLFQDTLHQAEIQKISILHIDCDWYESVKFCLEQLYDLVSVGGIIQFDDYGDLIGARRAVHEFLHSRSLPVDLRYIDFSGRQFVKPEIDPSK